MAIRRRLLYLIVNKMFFAFGSVKGKYSSSIGKTVLFSLICRFFSATTVFIAMTMDFIAMKTVVTIYGLGNSRQRRRSSRKSSAQLTEKKREKAFGVNGRGSTLSTNIRFSGS